MGKVLRCLLLLATLGLWMGPAGAFCIAEVAYEYVMRGDSTPEQSLPCCIASGAVVAPGQKDRPIEGRVRARATVTPAARDTLCPAPAGPAASPLRWRAYCERSSRLLR